MAYVYRYVDIVDNIIKYVGIVYGESRSLEQRINEHKNDYWYKNSIWKVEYLDIEIRTRTDAEFYESHFISYFQTDKYYNISKSGWGVSDLISNDESQWKTFQIDDQFKEKIPPLYPVMTILMTEKEKRKSVFENIISALSPFYKKKKDLLKYLNNELNDTIFGQYTTLNSAKFDDMGNVTINFKLPTSFKYDNNMFIFETNNEFALYSGHKLKEMKANDYADELIRLGNIIKELSM